jgi:hypothetical protein
VVVISPFRPARREANKRIGPGIRFTNQWSTKPKSGLRSGG